MHVQENVRADSKTLFCSFVYADNYYVDRRALWSNLGAHADLMRNKPWVLLRDFNVALNLLDHSCGGYEPNIAMREFKDCVQSMEVMDVNSTDLNFIWNQKPRGSNGILKKIDRIMDNLKFNDDFLRSFAIFQPNCISNHSPCVLCMPKVSRLKHFKLFNFLVHKEGFHSMVEDGWNLNVDGFPMYRVVKRLKGLKSLLHKLLHDQGNLHDRVNRLRVELDKTQKAIDGDTSSAILQEKHAHYLVAFKEDSLDEDRFFKQKSKVEWLNAGDSYTSYFHRVFKSKCAWNRIEMVRDSSNVFYEGNAVVGAFVTHYETFLGSKGCTILLHDQDLYSRALDAHKADAMVRDVTDFKVKAAIFSMGDDKVSRPDGFTAAFFVNSKLLKELNHTIISLIPKVTTPARINDYRPISCCNVLYKCISKIIVNRNKEGLGDLVSKNQSAFFLGRKILDNILLTQELMRNYHRRSGPPRCDFKVDIQKAYDIVDRQFLKTIIVGFGFHPKMVKWIMVCASSTSYSICVNGNINGWFNGK
ncbi:sodium/hydrogen exchanger 6 [Tanacetum coccineum]